MAKYKEWLEGDNLILLEGWARDGLTDEQIAHNIGINRDTLYTWKKKYPDFADTLKKTKEVVDRQVENALSCHYPKRDKNNERTTRNHEKGGNARCLCQSAEYAAGKNRSAKCASVKRTDIDIMTGNAGIKNQQRSTIRRNGYGRKRQSRLGLADAMNTSKRRRAE